VVPASSRCVEKEGHISDLAQLLEALQFAAHKHRAQRRKDADASPYINHPLEVATILATTGAISDLATLLAAVLHDTIEDTETTPEELEERFGPEVRSLVLEVTDDKRLPKEERKRLQVEHAPSLSPKAKLIKLGDKIANVHDVTATPPADWTLERRRDYLDWTEQVVQGCRGANPSLERRYDEALRSGRAVSSRRGVELAGARRRG
jgi:guanosine-3',5'-bis(diphosphate) 3'-pyrophosphohydrolase